MRGLELSTPLTKGHDQLTSLNRSVITLIPRPTFGRHFILSNKMAAGSGAENAHAKGKGGG